MFEDIFGLPRKCTDIGDIYPILLKDYALFSNYSWILKYDKRHTYTTSDDVSTLEAILFKEFTCEFLEGLTGNNLVKYKIFSLQGVIEMVTRKPVAYDVQSRCYYIGDKNDEDNVGVLGVYNYDQFRKIVMEQNLIHQEKFYKSKLVEQWMSDAKKVKESNSSNVQFEDIVSTIKNMTGFSYEDIYKQTYYQTITDYKRILNIKAHDMSVLFASQHGTKAVKIIDMSENLDLQKNPNDDLVRKYNDFIGKVQ